MAMKSLPQIVLVRLRSACRLRRTGSRCGNRPDQKSPRGGISFAQTDQLPAKAGDLVEQSDVMITGSNGSVGFTFIDSSRLSVGPNSRIEFKQFRFNPTTQEGESLTQVHRGTLAMVSGQIAKRSPDAMKVQTPTTILGVRGTKFAVKVEE